MRSQSVAEPADARQETYLGFDRNDYPGDASLGALAKNFRYSSYWLNPPPGETGNSWAGKRALLRENGFGFLVLFNGRSDAQLKAHDAASLGTADGNAAVASALNEGFPKHVLIFLDQEEGGRLLPEQSAYLFAWVDAVRKAGARAGVYCSGIDVPDGATTISTAEDVVEKENARRENRPLAGRMEQLVLWIANDQCPPSPGCALTHAAPGGGFQSFPVEIGVWQYAQSPRRAQFSASCPRNAAADNNCYAPGLPQTPGSFVDLDTAGSADPSGGR